MGIAAAKGLTAPGAVAIVREHLDELFSDQPLENVLLQELDSDEATGNRPVAIGFDMGRKAIRRPGRNALAMFGNQDVTPDCENRRFEIADEDGSLVRMRHV